MEMPRAGRGREVAENKDSSGEVAARGLRDHGYVNTSSIRIIIVSVFARKNREPFGEIEHYRHSKFN